MARCDRLVLSVSLSMLQQISTLGHNIKQWLTACESVFVLCSPHPQQISSPTIVMCTQRVSAALTTRPAHFAHLLVTLARAMANLTIVCLTAQDLLL